MKSVPELLKKIGRILWYGRSYFSFLDFPILCRLPYGCWFLARGDESGLIAFFRLPYEKKEWRFVKKFLKPRMTFFDIGANQGFYTLLAAKCVGAEGKVFAFEPVPREFQNLKWNVLINRFKNVKIESMALGFKEGVTEMVVCLDGKGSYSSLRFPSDKVKARKKIIKVPITTLDTYVLRNKILSIDLLKLDVEGGELNVLKGGVNVLSNLRPVLMSEVSDKRTKQWGYSAFEIINFVKRYKYRWFKFTFGGSICPLDDKAIFDENLLAIPEEKIKSFSIV
jgi:FkbM family methyltransferase